MHGWEHMNWGWAGKILQIIFWLLIFIGIIWMIKYFLEKGKNGSAGETALDILKKRYAICL